MSDYYYTDHNRQPAGPVPYEDLRGMYERGELAEGALVAEVGAEQWQEAQAVFGGASPPAPAMAPPVHPGQIAGGGDRFEALAGWSFGLGIASWACIGILPAIPGVILGHMALRKLSREGNTNGASKVLAIIGLVASYANLLIIPVFLVIGLGFGLLSSFVP